MPTDLGSRGSCMIGGNLSTNAGGTRFIRNNSLHANCIGLKAVLPNGEILDNMITMRKDNTGYDIKHLFIGAEGTLGIITECAILCPPYETNRKLAMLAVDSFESVQEILKLARRELGTGLSAIEFMDSHAMNLVTRQFKSVARFPFDNDHPFYMLIEVTSRKDDDGEELLDLLAMIDTHMAEGVIAQDQKQYE